MIASLLPVAGFDLMAMVFLAAFVGCVAFVVVIGLLDLAKERRDRRG